jgi:hypothetical protein
MKVKISGKCIPTDFFVIDAYHSNHDHIILGRPFLKLVDAVFDAEEGKVTMSLLMVNFRQLRVLVIHWLRL